MSNGNEFNPKACFTLQELESLSDEPILCNQSRRTFLKWGAVLTSQAIAGGGLLNLLTGSEALADDTFDNVIDWNYSVCGYCSFGCGLEIGVDSNGRAVAVRGNGKHPTNAGRLCVKGLYEHKVLNNEDLRVGKEEGLLLFDDHARRMWTVRGGGSEGSSIRLAVSFGNGMVGVDGPPSSPSSR